MGVDVAIFRELVKLRGRSFPEGRRLMLGRQTLRLKRSNRPAVRAALAGAGMDIDLPDLRQPDDFTETMWDRLGLGPMETLDLSDFEGATVLHDLNDPVPTDLHGQFAFIFDGGTLEHVFDVPRALENMFHMLAPGGLFVSVNGLNGWPGHGLYQFNPDLVWTFWKRRAGCEVIRCAGLCRDEDLPPVAFEDMGDWGTRLRLARRLPTSRTYLYYEVVKPDAASLAGAVLQSDYAAKWRQHETGEVKFA